MEKNEVSQIVWHDLFTEDRQCAMSFYQNVAGWTYVTEQASDFTWGGGEQSYVLALSGQEAGAGFIIASPGFATGWIVYVEVPDVDATSALTEKLGGSIVRSPFDVPGVGRSALLRDPRGARFGITFSRHSFPVPQHQFGTEIYLTGVQPFPATFYSNLFGWKCLEAPDDTHPQRVVSATDGKDVALILNDEKTVSRPACWVPAIKIKEQAGFRKKAQGPGTATTGPVFAEKSLRKSSLQEDPDRAVILLNVT